MTKSSEREPAWDQVLHATPPGWYVGQPSYHDERRQWLLYAFDREWTAVAPSEECVVREMARCLREIAAGQIPK